MNSTKTTATETTYDENGITTSEREVSVWAVRSSDWNPEGPDGIYIAVSDEDEGDGLGVGITITDETLAALGYVKA